MGQLALQYLPTDLSLWHLERTWLYWITLVALSIERAWFVWCGLRASKTPQPAPQPPQGPWTRPAPSRNLLNLIGWVQFALSVAALLLFALGSAAAFYAILLSALPIFVTFFVTIPYARAGQQTGTVIGTLIGSLVQFAVELAIIITLDPATPALWG